MRSADRAEQVEGEAALYALGALPAPDAERFRQRVAAGCDLCTGALDECRRAVALLPLAAPDAEPPSNLRARLLDRVAGGRAKQGPAGTIVRTGDTVWVDAPAPGVQYRKLHGSKTMLVRMAPDTWLPEHEHKSAEQCLVLEGSIQTEDMTAHAGDYVYMPAGSVHPPIYSKTGATFLIAYS